MDIIQTAPSDRDTPSFDTLNVSNEEVLVVLPTEVHAEVEVVTIPCPTKTDRPRQKQKRKDPIILRPLSEEDEKMELRVIEELSPGVQVIAIKRKPRKEYRTKKRLRLAAMQEGEHQQQQLQPKSPRPQEHPQPQSPKQRQSPKQQQLQEQMPERRTRLSNACRVATGKSYKCNDCDFSTDRINNIIIHIKESCPKLKRP